MGISDYLRVLKQGWLIILVCVALGVAGAAAVSAFATPQFRSVATLYFSIPNNESTTTAEFGQGFEAIQYKVASYAGVATTPKVLNPVIDELKLDMSPEQLKAKISAFPTIQTVLLNISVDDSDAQRGANIANATANSLSKVIEDELEAPLGGGTSPVAVTVVQKAEPQSTPMSPNIPTNLLLGALIGLAVGIIGAVIRALSDTTIRRTRDITAVTDVPIIGAVDFDKRVANDPLVLLSAPHGRQAESYRAVRTSIQLADLGTGGRSILVTSAGPDEGKSVSVVNLALAFGQTGSRVVVVDADLRRPRIAPLLGIGHAVGLSEYLTGAVGLNEITHRVQGQEVVVIPAGAVPSNPSELLGSDAFRALLAELGTKFDYVLVDAPPVLAVTDAVLLSASVGAVVVVVGAGKSRKADVTRTLSTLRDAGAPVLGIVATMLPRESGYDATSYVAYGSLTGDSAARR
ncbi:polysaccharide biosynthesis tyrosine autokinase [Rathayibacter sp. YIM 133350]|uniref:polysaccharide biosynthesis tyrosine autokinase n=1 Tax=Rathayibacter sp. YIM 133350 TaxID=3131992 RepID=UPI00307F8A54